MTAVEMTGSVMSARRVAPEHQRLQERLRRAYGFDDVALVPGTVAADPADVDTAWSLGAHRLPLPILASAMDGVVDPSFAIELGRLGGLAVMNLEGLQTRYDDPSEPLAAIAAAAAEQVTGLLQDLYRAPIRDNLVGDRIREIKAGGVLTAVSALTPWALSRRVLGAVLGPR